MENIRLYLIDDSEENNPKHYAVDLDEQVQFAITSQFEDLNNPTTIINTWSKSISIPFTVNNNRIFSQLYRPDRAVTPDNPLGTFDFDATQKVSFILTYLDALVMDGFMKILSIERESDIKGKYNVTLNGELGKVLQTLQKLNFDYKEDDKYSIDSSKYVKGIMTADLVKRCWENVPTQKTTEPLKHYGEQGYDILDYIGFAPNLSFSEGFDYNLAELPTGNIPQVVSLSDLADEQGEIQHLSYKQSDYIKDGLNPRSFGEFRSWLQIPYIYFNKLFNIFKEEGERITGYKFILDKSWFDDSNPYWSKQVMCLDRLFSKQPSETGLFTLHWTNENEFPYSTYSPTYTRENPLSVLPKTVGIYAEKFKEGFGYNKENRSFMRDYRNKILNFSIPNTKTKIEITCTLDGEHTEDTTRWFVNPNTCIYLEYQWLDVDKGVVYPFYRRLCSEDCTVPNPNSYLNAYIDNIKYEYNSSTDKTKCTISWNIQNNYPLYTISELQLQMSYWRNDDNNVFLTYSYNNGEVQVLYDYSLGFTADWELQGVSSIISFTPFDLKGFWNSKYTLYDIIIEYCKLYKILIVCDSIKNTLTFIPSKIYFKNYTIEDWSNKVDYSKPFKIENIMTQDYSFKFNYNNDKLNSIQENYKKINNKLLGEDNFITRNNFNLDSNDLFKYQQSSVIYSPALLNWDILYEAKKDSITYYSLNENYISTSDKDNKEVSCFGQFYFLKALKSFEDNFRKVIITDETNTQILQQTYYYNQTIIDEDRDYVLTYPGLSNSYRIVNQVLYNYYSVPNQTYIVGNEDYIEDDIDNIIYTPIKKAFWNVYLDSTYNVNTKLVECYVRISNLDYLNFQYNHLIKIDNTLYLVNKIYDYSLTENSVTKVQLKSLNSLNGLITDNYNVVDIYPRQQSVTGLFDFTVYIKVWDSDGFNSNKLSLEGVIGLPLIGWTLTHSINDGVIEVNITRDTFSQEISANIDMLWNYAGVQFPTIIKVN